MEEMLAGSRRLVPAFSIDRWHEYFTWGCLVVYGPPTLVTMRIAADASVAYWAGLSGWLVLFVPALIFLWRAVLSSFDAPRVATVLPSSLAPALLLAWLAELYMSTADELAPRLMSTDCVTFPAKLEVQRSWEAAERIHRRCVEHISEASGLSPAAVRLQDCVEFADLITSDVDTWEEHHATWDYLRELEEDSACSGWCYHARPLWTRERTKDPCSVVVGAALEYKVKSAATQVMVFCCVVTVAVFACVALLRKLVQK
jgi:hypothetical protein